MLLKLVSEFGFKDWKISKALNKSVVKCHKRYLELTANSTNASKNKLWTEEEDKFLIDLVKTYGKGDWTMIADSMPKKIAK